MIQGVKRKALNIVEGHTSPNPIQVSSGGFKGGGGARGACPLYFWQNLVKSAHFPPIWPRHPLFLRILDPLLVSVKKVALDNLSTQKNETEEMHYGKTWITSFQSYK